MSLSKDRGIVADVVIGLLACGAAFTFLVHPLDKQARAARARADALTSQGYAPLGSSVSTPSAAALRAVAAEVAKAARELQGRGREAMNEVAMLGSLTQLARSHDLVIDQLQPDMQSEPKLALAPALPDQPSPPPPPDDRSSGYTFTVRGEYAHITAFLRELSAQLPGTTIANLRVSPTMESGGPPVAAIVSTRHWCFDAGAPIRLAEAAASTPE